MAVNYKRQWKNILVNPRYQLRYVFWIGATGVSLILLYSGIVYRYVSENYSILVELSPMDAQAKQQLYLELNQLLVKLGVGAFVFLMVCLFLGLILSHRTAGPLYHFKRVFNEIEAGKLGARVRLRPKDDFQDVAEAFNRMMDSLGKR